MSLIFQPNSSCWLSIKPLWLSKQSSWFLMALVIEYVPGKSCQGPKGEDLNQHLDVSELEARSSGRSFKCMQADLFQGKKSCAFLVFSLCIDPWGNSQLRTLSSFAIVLWDLWIQDPLPTKARLSGVCSLGTGHKSQCVREILVTKSEPEEKCRNGANQLPWKRTAICPLKCAQLEAWLWQWLKICKKGLLLRKARRWAVLSAPSLLSPGRTAC